MTFKFQYQDVVRRPNPMNNINPLARSSGKQATYGDRVEQLENSNLWQKSVRAHEAAGRTFDVNLIPQIAKVPLGEIIIDEDIQRGLEVKHCSNTIGGAKFDPRYLSTLICAKSPTTGKYISIDGQQSGSTVASMVHAGLFNTNDWKTLEYPVQYVVTDDLSFARKAFGIVNGKGKLKQSLFNELRNSIFCIRIDGNTEDPDDVQALRKVEIGEKYDCYPVEINSKLTKYPGTFTHISLFNLATEEALESAFSWHNEYFHMDGVHASVFPLFRDIIRDFKSAKIEFTDKLARELAAMIQSLFGDMTEFGQAAMAARTAWHNARYGYEGNWSDDQYAAVLFQLYVKLGGEENVPLVLLDKYFDPKSNTGIPDFLASEILDLAEAA